MRLNKVSIKKMGVAFKNTVYVFALTKGQLLIRIKTPDACE
jgi:hypothetical protein